MLRALLADPTAEVQEQAVCALRNLCMDCEWSTELLMFV